MNDRVLVRYGAVPEVARFRVAVERPLPRGSQVVVRSHRGIELGELLQDALPDAANGIGEDDPVVLRSAGPDDVSRAGELRSECEWAFGEWSERIARWKLDLQLIDLEWTLDRQKLVLYVLNDRGPECTKLALQAAAAGLGIVEVQPVNGDGLVQAATGGGCGTGGCGSGGCH
ncbi:MAG: hypothetical protein KY476_19100 [Planctomycetes bacterium]|nr:hypothetical protein [Planctomycetota bacterium]